MDTDIQFGDVQQPAPQRRMRPDRNHHYAVVPCHSPSDGDLPIYIDMDVARDIEAHARSNTNVELGGVLLGGRYEDENGKPFVFVTDSLRATHYEADSGSFKFTHETWSDITRRRNQFPDETEMVGWYHTHPGWGLFLSGMDTFICNHFFTHPLDVALVVDPRGSKRVFFQWSRNGEARRLRATGGFYLASSRFRLAELEVFKAQLEVTTPMPNDPRYPGLAGSHPPPVVQINEPRQAWFVLAVLGIFLVQFSVLALLAWRGLSVRETPSATPTTVQAVQLRAERRMLDEIIGELEVAPDGIVESLEEYRRKNRELETVRLGLGTHIEELKKNQRSLAKENDALLKQQQELRTSLAEFRRERRAARDTIAELKAELRQYRKPADESRRASSPWGWMIRWKWYLAGGALLLLAALAMLWTYYGPTWAAKVTALKEPTDQQ